MNLNGANSAFGVGSIVVGKFRIERMLAEGGMGLVVAATHLQLEQTVALKFFRGELGTQGEPLMRFMREAKAAAQLKSEHVARVLDVGVTEDGTPYMVMEYLEGQGLESVIAAEGPLDVPSATEYAIQACEGLAEAHARGIVHRDIKPSNLFLAERSPGWRTIKILDFGISKVSLAQASNITTHLNMVMGTPCYMSPEQLQSTATVDHRTDIWSLGASLYEMLAGKSPFDASLPLLAIAEAIVSKPVPTLRELRPEIPQELSAIVARCMSKDREERFQSAAALAMALLPFARVRARVSAERAASMTPALGVGRTGQRPPSLESTPGLQWGIVTQDLPGNPTPPARENPLPGVGPGPSHDGRAFEVTESPAVEENQGQPAAVAAVGWWPPSPKALVVSGAILICAVAAMAAVDARRQRQQAIVTVPMVVRPLPSPPASAAPALSELVVTVSPSSAQITIDGVVVSGNPFRGRFPRGETRLIQALATGYEPKVQRVSMTSDVVIDLSLDRKQRTSSGRQGNSTGGRQGNSTTGRTRTTKSAQTETVRPEPVRPIDATPARGQSFVAPEVVDPAGGRAPLHQIQTKNPYGNP